MDEAEINSKNPLKHISSEQWEEFVDRMNNDVSLLSATQLVDRYNLLLVLAGVRPACHMGSYRMVSSQEAAEGFRGVPECYIKTDALGKFLSRFDIPYYFDLSLSHARDGRIQVIGNYHISYNSDKREHLRAALEDSSPWEAPTKEEHIALGHFLDYPESAIAEWCSGFQPEDSLLENLSDETVLEEMGELAPLIERHDLDPPSFVRTLLPYMVPVSADCYDRAFDDAKRFFAWGYLLTLTTELDIIYRLMAAHKEYWSGPLPTPANRTQSVTNDCDSTT